MKNLTIADLKRIAIRLSLTVKSGPRSMCWADQMLIHIAQRDAKNPHVLAHEIAHCVHDGRSSWRLYHTRKGGMCLALRCEENICDAVADAMTGKHRESPKWPPVTGRAAFYCTHKVQIVINKLREVHAQTEV